MSLNFDTSKIADKAFLTRMGSDVPGVMEDPKEEYWSHEITSVIHWCMITSIGTITEANHEKWYARYLAYNRAMGYSAGDQFLTLEMVRKSIGLSTNASNETDAAFWKWLRSLMEREIQSQITGERRKLDEPTAEV